MKTIQEIRAIANAAIEKRAEVLLKEIHHQIFICAKRGQTSTLVYLGTDAPEKLRFLIVVDLKTAGFNVRPDDTGDNGRNTFVVDWSE